MAITPVISNETAAVTPGTSSDFTTTVRGFWLFAEGFEEGECAWLQHAGPSGAFINTTNENGAIVVGKIPNAIFVDLPAGTYYLGKTATVAGVYVGFEQVS
jgi:hypothetical protein